MRRLKIFREQNEEDITVLNYFDELEIHPENISECCLSVRERERVRNSSPMSLDVAEDTSPNMEKTVEHIKKIIKVPRNYGK